VVYQWKDGARFNADAGKVAEELNRLPEKTPAAALALAENEKTELHKCATWEDAKAAHLYRLEEMRSVIRSVVVYDEKPDRTPITYRAYEYVVINKGEDEKPKKRFIETASALSDPDFKKQVFSEIKTAISELSAKAKTYRYLAEEEIDEVQRHLEIAKEAVTV